MMERNAWDAEGRTCSKNGPVQDLEPGSLRSGLSVVRALPGEPPDMGHFLRESKACAKML